MLSVLIVHPDAERRQALGQRLLEAGYAVAQAQDPDGVPQKLQVDAWVAHGQLSLQERQAVLGRIGRAYEVVDSGADAPVLQALATLATQASPLVRLGVGSVDLRGRRVLRDGLPVTLTDRESALLAWLLSRQGQVVSRSELLVNVWGYRPDMVTRTVDVTVARLREKIERDKNNPEHLLTVRGEGYRLVGLEPRKETPEHPGLVGRDADLARLRRAMGPGRLVNIWGPGGVGKTTLARAIASECDAQWVELLGISEGVMVAVARALELPNLKTVSPESLARALSHRGVRVLVLDNAEHVVQEARAFADALLLGAPDVCLLVTSRVRLEAEVEVMVKLAPLQAKAPRTLLLARAQARVPGWGAQDPAVAGILEILDGLPLALELAAGRAAVMEPAQLLERLKASTTLLRDGQTSLSGAIDWSWQLLDPVAQGALAALSVFRGGATLEALESVLPQPPGVLAEAVDELLSSSLIRRVGRRFWPFVGVAERALQGPQAELLEAHARYYGQWVIEQNAAAWGPAGWQALSTLREDRENLLQALDHPDVAGDLAVGLLHEWETRDAPPHEVARVEATLQLELPDGQRAKVLRVLIWARLQFGRLSQTQELADALLVLLPALPTLDAAWAHYVLGDIGRFSREDRGDSHLLQVIALAPESPGALRAFLYLMDNAGGEGRFEEANQYFERAEALCAQLDSQTLSATTRCAHAALLLRLRRWERALAACRAGQAEKEELPLALVGAYAAMSGVALRGCGRHEEALQAFESCLAMYRNWGAVRLEGVALENRARSLLALGRLDEALDSALLSSRLAGRSAGVRVEMMARITTVKVWLAKGLLPEASEELQAAETLALKHGLDLVKVEVVAMREQLKAAESAV